MGGGATFGNVWAFKVPVIAQRPLKTQAWGKLNGGVEAGSHEEAVLSSISSRWAVAHNHLLLT